MARSSVFAASVQPPLAELVSLYVYLSLSCQHHVNTLTLVDVVPRRPPVLWQVRFDVHIPARYKTSCSVAALCRSSQLMSRNESYTHKSSDSKHDPFGTSRHETDKNLTGYAMIKYPLASLLCCCRRELYLATASQLYCFIVLRFETSTSQD